MQKKTKITLAVLAATAALTTGAGIALADGDGDGWGWGRGHRMGMMGGAMDGPMGMMDDQMGMMDGPMGMMDGPMGMMGSHRGRMGMGMMGGMMGAGPGGAAIDFAAADADKDGKLTAEELKGWRASVTAGIDANQDGKLSADEITQAGVKALTARLQEHAQAMVTRLDSDGDGLLSAAELLARPMAGPDFQVLDRSGDGAVTKDELAPPQGRGPIAAPAPTVPAAPADGSGN